MYTMIVEQTKKYPKRMRYDPENNTFTETKCDSRGYLRGETFPYGWLKESGTPPGEHLDVFLVSEDDFELGDEVPIRVIGVFMRNDGDNKLIAVKWDCPEKDLDDLPEYERKKVQGLYEGKYPGDTWFGAAEAEAEINRFYSEGRNKL